MCSHRNVYVLSISAVIALLFAFAASPGAAQSRAYFELYTGYYVPEEDLLDEDLSFGVRGGLRPKADKHLGFEGTLGRFETEALGFGFDFTLVDLSAVWHTRPDGPVDVLFFAGPGWAFIDVDSPLLSGSDDSLSAHLGIGVAFDVKDRFYLRPDLRARWIDESGDIDLEMSFAFGFKL